MPARRNRALLSVVLAAGCSMRADFSSTGFLCDETSACPDSQECFDGVCRAAPIDAGVPIDAGNPTLLAWQSTAPLPAARDYNLAHAASVPGFVYLIGGYDNGEGTEQATVFRAEAGASGALGGWDETTSLPEPRALADLAVVADRVYVVGGARDAAATSTVYHAPVNANGSLGAWSQTTPLPARRKGHAVFAANGFLYALGGEDESGDLHATVFVARVEEGGGVAAWQEADPLPAARTAAAGVFADGAVYLLGGVNPASTIHATAFVAPVQAEGGALGPWSETRELPAARRSAAGFSWRGHIYLVGGLTEAGATDEVIHALIGADRELGAWQANTPLPAPRARHAGVLAGEYLYVIGGTGADDGAVFYTTSE